MRRPVNRRHSSNHRSYRRNGRRLYEAKANKDLEKRFEKYLDRLDDNELVSMWNRYCSETGHEGYIEYMSDFNDLNRDADLLDIVDSAINGDFNVVDDYWGYSLQTGWLTSYEDAEDAIDAQGDIDDLVNYIVDHNDDMDDEGLYDILNGK